MIPLRDVVPTRTPPLATVVLIAAQLLLLARISPGAALIPLIANIVCLWNFGHTVEDRMGHARFALFYALCGGVGVLVQAAAGGGPPLVAGLAGGVAGVVGAYLALYPHSRIITLLPIPFDARVIELPAVVLASAWVLMQFASRVGLAGLAAAAAGAAVVRIFRRPERMRIEWWDEH